MNWINPKHPSEIGLHKSANSRMVGEAIAASLDLLADQETRFQLLSDICHKRRVGVTFAWGDDGLDIDQFHPLRCSCKVPRTSKLLELSHEIALATKRPALTFTLVTVGNFWVQSFVTFAYREPVTVAVKSAIWDLEKNTVSPCRWWYDGAEFERSLEARSNVLSLTEMYR